jgi:integrase/recombinase XerD
MHGRGVKKRIIMGISVIITEDFERWLRAIGYAESTVYGSVRYLRDFLEWLEPTPVKEISQITPEVIRTYHRYLQQRANRRQGGSLSENYIVSNINALKRFSRYLQETGRATLEVDLQLKVIAMETKTILSMKEIMSLYRACGNDILGIREVGDHPGSWFRARRQHVALPDRTPGANTQYSFAHRGIHSRTAR